jgi:hypothetical protein
MLFRVLIFFIFGMIACAKAPDFPNTPAISFIGFDRDTLTQGEFNDSTFVLLSFTDGDGDFGSDTQSNNANIFFKDKRTNVISQYKAPLIPSQGANNGIRGTIKILLRSTCCIFPEPTGIPPCEVVADYPINVLEYEIFIKDRSLNVSNTVTTSRLILFCK